VRLPIPGQVVPCSVAPRIEAGCPPRQLWRKCMPWPSCPYHPAAPIGRRSPRPIPALAEATVCARSTKRSSPRAGAYLVVGEPPQVRSRVRPAACSEPGATTLRGAGSPAALPVGWALARRAGKAGECGSGHCAGRTAGLAIRLRRMCRTSPRFPALGLSYQTNRNVAGRLPRSNRAPGSGASKAPIETRQRAACYGATPGARQPSARERSSEGAHRGTTTSSLLRRNTSK
jgi:hypothetical protein